MGIDKRGSEQRSLDQNRENLLEQNREDIFAKNREKIYEQAMGSKDGAVYAAISNIRKGIVQEIENNRIPNGFNEKVEEILAAQKQKDPTLDTKSVPVLQGAVNAAVDDMTHQRFIDTLKGKSEQNPLMAAIANIIAIFSKANKLVDGTWEQTFAVLNEGFAKEAKALSTAWHAEEGFMARFSKDARNENIANTLKITDENERQALIAALSSEKPIVLAKPTVVAYLSPAERLATALEAEKAKTAGSGVKGGGDATTPKSSQAGLPANGSSPARQQSEAGR